MSFFHNLKQKMCSVKYEPLGCQESKLGTITTIMTSHASTVSRSYSGLYSFPSDFFFDQSETSEEESPELSKPVSMIASARQHWDSALADTVPVEGCSCRFCKCRTAEDIGRDVRKEKLEARRFSGSFYNLSRVANISLPPFSSKDSRRSSSASTSSFVSSSSSNSRETRTAPLASSFR